MKGEIEKLIEELDSKDDEIEDLLAKKGPR